MVDAMIEFFKEKTVYSEEVIGCYVSCYGIKGVCSGVQNCGCKHLHACESMNKIRRE